ncbi:MAG: hypothetical protein IT469_10650 [Pseudomonadales bacterium]|nr:hypothetical protein [Pseudomonadales bacterium]
MKTRKLLLAAALGSAVLSGGALAQGGMGMGMHGGMMMGEGKVTKEEFLKQAETRFAHMDFNKDGVIDASDRQQMQERMQGCMEMMGGMGMMGGGMMGGGMMSGPGAGTQEHEMHHP